MQRVFFPVSLVLIAVSFPGWAGAPRGVPTPGQLAWHVLEQQMFLCLDPCTWQGREYDDHSTPLSEINPAALDTEQWCAAAKAFGAKQILFVAKHTGGFCWWPTQTTEYCVRSIPWKDGKGDVLGELAESCRRHGLKLGVYIYPGDDQWGAGIGSGGKTADPAKQAEYNAVLRRQWTEVLTNYGEISELWFDGSCVVDLADIIREHAPNAMIFQGPLATLRWPGNEAGVCPDPAWQTVRRADAASGVATGTLSDPDGETWLPMEMDTPLLDHKWFWAPDTDHMLKSVDKLMDIYCQSVGRGGVLLLNATPDTSGLIPGPHMRRYREFGKAIQAFYAGKAGETAGTGTELVLKLAQPAEITHVVIRENIEKGHVVRAFTVEGLSEGKWRRLAEAQSVGYKRIERFAPVRVEALRLRVTKSVDTPEILQFAAYGGGNASAAEAGSGPDWIPVPGFQDLSPPDQWQTVEADLTPVVTRPGEYAVEIVRTSGNGELETEDATLLIAGGKAPRLVTPGSAPNTWLVRRTDQVTDDEKGKTVLRLRVRRTGGEWTGKMRIRPGTDSGS